MEQALEKKDRWTLEELKGRFENIIGLICAHLEEREAIEQKTRDSIAKLVESVGRGLQQGLGTTTDNTAAGDIKQKCSQQ